MTTVPSVEENEVLTDCPGADAAALEIVGLTKEFDGKPVVQNLSLRVAAGSIIGLLGPNGAGKTTTLRSVAGLLQPDSGKISISGYTISEKPQEARMRLGFAGQETALYPGLTVRQNLTYFGELASPKKIAASTMEWLVESLEIGHLWSRKVMTLSLGQQRLVHVACALAHRPAVVILDEPTAGLDVSARHALHRTLRTLAKDGAAVLFSSHYLGEVQDLCDGAVIIHQGVVIAAGSVSILIAEHGGGQVEVVVGEEIFVQPGVDVVGALAQIATGTQVDAVRVVPPSLLAVYLSLTGQHSTDEGSDQ